MDVVIAVGHPAGLGPAGGWDLWPVIGAIAGLWLALRASRLRWGIATLLITIVASLAFPLLVETLGLVGTAAAWTALWVVAVKVRRTATPPGRTV